jgi:hypothetical protein
MNPYSWLFVLLLVLVEIYSLIPTRPDSFHVGDMDRPDYVQGAIHVHSAFGEGTGSISQIAEAAGRAGLDFVVITDLNNAQARREGFEKTYGNVDAFIEMEAATPAGHLLVFYSQTAAAGWSDERVVKSAWNHFLGRDEIPGLFSVIAHPSNLKTPWNRLDRFAEGVEIVNFDSSWRRQLDDSFLGFATTLSLYPFNQYLSALRFASVYEKDLNAWDSMNALSTGHFGILGHDARARLKLNGSMSVAWPTYAQSFRMASNVVYLDGPAAKDFAIRKRQIYDSIRAGKIALVNSFLYPFDGNDWKVQCGEKSYRTGSRFNLEADKCEHLIRIPDRFPYAREVRIYRNGELFKKLDGTQPKFTLPLDTIGVYRVEVWAKTHSVFHALLNEPTPYLIYNPIYVR